MTKKITVSRIYLSSIYLIVMMFFSIISSSIFAQTAPQAVVSFKVDSGYNAYTYFAVNNTHYITSDDDGRIYIVFFDSTKNLILKTLDIGVWYSQTITGSVSGVKPKNATIEWKQGKLHVAWLEMASGNSKIKYALGSPAGIGMFNWSISTFATFPTNGQNYLTTGIPDSSDSPQMGFTEGNNARARMFNSIGESPLSPMNSGLGSWIRSSDISIAADSNIVVVAWEESYTSPHPKDNVVFTISYDGGQSWTAPQHLLNTGLTYGGDICLTIAGGYIYIAYQSPTFASSSSDIIVARMLPGMTQFELVNLGTTPMGSVGKGWLANIYANKAHPDRVVVSWERTDGQFFVNHEHRVAVAYILNAYETPNLILGPETTSSPSDTLLYDLNSNIIISPDGQTVSFVWVNIEEFDATNTLMTLYFQQEIIPIPSGIKESTNSSPVMMYPNPVVGALRFTKPQEGIRIYNIQGELMTEINEATSFISVDNFPAGIYFIKTKTRFGKFIKVN